MTETPKRRTRDQLNALEDAHRRIARVIRTLQAMPDHADELALLGQALTALHDAQVMFYRNLINQPAPDSAPARTEIQEGSP